MKTPLDIGDAVVSIAADVPHPHYRDGFVAGMRHSKDEGTLVEVVHRFNRGLRRVEERRSYKLVDVVPREVWRTMMAASSEHYLSSDDAFLSLMRKLSKAWNEPEIYKDQSPRMLGYASQPPVTARWWLGWYEPLVDGDVLLETWPPPRPVLGYWSTGETDEVAPRSLTVAWVEAPTEEEAWDIVFACLPAGERERRFCERKDTMAPNERFSAPTWAVEDGRWPT